MATADDFFAKASQYHAQGNLALAEQLSWSVLGQEPNHANALQLLGLIAQQKGDLPQAIDYLNRSLHCDRSNADTVHQLGIVYLAFKDFPNAVAQFEQAICLRPDFGEAYNNLGLALLHVEQWPKAILCLKEAIRLMPCCGPALSNLGMGLKGMGELAEAANAFERALRLQPQNAKVAYNVAVTLHENSELDQAVTYYRLALLLEPGYVKASNNLAKALKEQGLLDEAIAQFQETLKLQPDHAHAYYNLSEFVAEDKYHFEPDQLECIKGIVESERYSALERSLCCSALATVFNKQGVYDDAFSYYKRANDLTKRLNQERKTVFDAHGHEAMVDRIIATYDHAFFARVQGLGMGTDLPVFIIGMPRSGSTLVEQILASHPLVFGAGEGGEIQRLIAKLFAAANVALLNGESTTHTLAASYLQHIASHAKSAARITVKTLDNYFYLGVIAAVFPRARIIHCRRDPIDVCLSCYFTNFQEVFFACSLEDIGSYHRSYEKLMAHWSGVLPTRIHEVQYEDLVNNQKAVSRDLIAFCGLEWDERCLTFWSTRRAVQTASTVQVRKPISRAAIGRWKNYRRHLGPLFQALGLPDRTSVAPATASGDGLLGQTSK